MKAKLELLNSTVFFSLTIILLQGFTQLKTNNLSDSSSSIISDGAKLKLISRQFSFTEGPAVDKKGNIYFTDQPNDKIWKYSNKGKLNEFLSNTGRSNGLYITKKGEIIACADKNNQLLSITKKGKVKVLVDDFKGYRFNGPNDLWITPKGDIFFTDPYYQRDYWIRKTPDMRDQNVYYLPKGQSQAQIADDKLIKPNGIVGTPDGKYLYVADIGANKTFKYHIGTNGNLTNKVLFVSQGSDGIVLDNQGNLYLTGKGVTVYNSLGNKIEHIEVPENWTANLCFGGSKKNILFITASKGIYTLNMKVKGVE